MSSYVCMQVASTNNTVVARSGDEEHNDAPPDGHRERRFIAAHSILEGAVAPHQGTQYAF